MDPWRLWSQRLLKPGHLVPKDLRGSAGRLDPRDLQDFVAQKDLRGLLVLRGQRELAHVESRGRRESVDFRDQKVGKDHRVRLDQRVTPDHKAPLVRLVLLGLLVLGQKALRGHKVRLVLQVA